MQPTYHDLLLMLFVLRQCTTRTTWNVSVVIGNLLLEAEMVAGWPLERIELVTGSNGAWCVNN